MKEFLATICIVLVASFTAAQEPTAAFDALLSDLVEAGGPGAAVLVAKDGEVIYRKARGMADVEAGKDLSADHIFRIGSITKQFTAVAILQLVERGKLSLDDEIIPDYPVGGRKVTVEQLLNHTSGILPRVVHAGH